MAISLQAANDWVRSLQRQGIVPPNTRRVILDVQADKVPTIYYECWADEQVFQVDIVEALREWPAVRVSESGQ